MNVRNLLFASLLIMSGAAFAQIEPVIHDEWIPKSREPQNQQFKDGDYAFPAKPRNMWQIGLHVGVPQIAGDVRTDPFGGNHSPAFGVGLNIRKGLGYVTSLRLHGMYGVAYGTDYTPQTSQYNPTLNGEFVALNQQGASKYSTGADYTDKIWLPNYKTTIINGSLDIMFNLNNINFHNSKPKFLLYGFGGIGGMIYETKMDAINSATNTEYDFATLITSITDNNPDNKTIGGNKDKILEELHKDLLDGDYETQAEVANPLKIGDNKTKVLNPTLSVGLGVAWRLGSRVELGLEHRMSYFFDDLADGQRYSSNGDYTDHYDMFHYTQITLGVNLGKNSDQPMWEVNPLNYIYSKVAQMNPDELLKDSDDDGVIDRLDKEPDTPAGTPVDTHGVSLDSDKDGCKDSEDPEPFSTPNLPIENCQNVRSDVTKDQVEKMIQDALGKIGPQGNWYLPMIYFDLDKYNIRADAVPQLEYVAEIMKQYPKLKIEVVGNTDVRASESYNMKLSENRAKEAINYLVSKKGIDQGRFVMKYDGESKPLIPGTNLKESEHQINRRVEFHIAGTSL